MGKAMTSAKPVRLSATSNLHVPSSMPGKEERDRRMGEGARKWIEKRVGKVGTSGTVSHCVTLVSCPFFVARNDQRERERERERTNERMNEFFINEEARLFQAASLVGSVGPARSV